MRRYLFCKIKLVSLHLRRYFWVKILRDCALKSKSRILIYTLFYLEIHPKMKRERERWTANYTVTFNDLFACEMMEYFREQKFWGTSPLFNYPRKNEFLNMEIFYVHTSHHIFSNSQFKHQVAFEYLVKKEGPSSQ